MRKSAIGAILFIAIVGIETFYPLGDFMSTHLGLFGTWSGYVFAWLGLGCTAYEGGRIMERVMERKDEEI